jgi:glutathione S-transferase
LDELDLPYENIDAPDVFMMPALREVHPMAKVPALSDAGRPLFESAAICNWLCDSHPERQMIPPAGSWDRALHDQWTAFTLAELEANLWHTARNLFIYSEEERVPAVYEQNAREARRAAAVFDDHLKDREWLVGDRFSVADIFAGYALAWACWQDVAGGLDHVQAYVDRLQARPKCPYRPPEG